MQNKETIWGKHEGKGDRMIHIEGGHCSLKLKYLNGGWTIQHETLTKTADDFRFEYLTSNDKLGNAHIYQTGRSANLVVQPAMPPKPVVFRSNTKIIIRPQQTLRIYLIVPLYIQLYYKSAEADNLLAEFDTERLSDTWFGEPDSGTPAFAVGSRFGMNANDLQAAAHEILVPVNIHNSSTQLLELQRLLVRVDMMNIYQKGEQLIADLGIVEFKGQGQVAHIDFTTEKSTHGDSPRLIGKSRQASNRNLLGHSFHFIKQMTQL